ncbi:hypothetical protein T439DRAFT_50114 [Meredithblackwellia eburnea MCA 4105]
MLAYCSNADCGKKTWYGCGKHIPSVMDKIPLADRCDCEEHKPLPPGVLPPGASKSVHSSCLTQDLCQRWYVRKRPREAEVDGGASKATSVASLASCEGRGGY